MKFLCAPSVAAASVLAFALSPVAGAADEKNCQLKRFGSVELTVSDGKVVVPVVLDGKPGKMILNLASAFSAIWDRAVCMGRYPMHLGRNVLEQLRLYFATKEKMLYFTAADTTP